MTSEPVSGESTKDDDVLYSQGSLEIRESDIAEDFDFVKELVCVAVERLEDDWQGSHGRAFNEIRWGHLSAKAGPLVTDHLKLHVVTNLRMLLRTMTREAFLEGPKRHDHEDRLAEIESTLAAVERSLAAISDRVDSLKESCDRRSPDDTQRLNDRITSLEEASTFIESESRLGEVRSEIGHLHRALIQMCSLYPSQDARRVAAMSLLKKPPGTAGYEAWKRSIDSITQGNPSVTADHNSGEPAPDAPELQDMPGIAAIKAERLRQIELHGFDADHDDRCDSGSMLRVAMCYLASCFEQGPVQYVWPPEWDSCWDKRNQHGRQKKLAIVGALVAAVIDKDSREVDGNSDQRPIVRRTNQFNIKPNRPLEEVWEYRGKEHRTVTDPVFDRVLYYPAKPALLSVRKAFGIGVPIEDIRVDDVAGRSGRPFALDDPHYRPAT